MDKSELIDQFSRLEVERAGTTIFALGVMLTMYVENSHTPEARVALADCFDDYWNSARNDIQWVTQPGRVDPEEGIKYRWAQPAEEPIVRPRDWIFDLTENHAWSVTAHGGRTHQDASPFQLEITSPGAWKQALGYLTASWALPTFESRQERFRMLVSRWVDMLKPLHGYAGLGLILPLDGASLPRIAPQAYGVARRFPGLELDAPVYQVRRLHDGIKGVNWLTFVGNRLLDRLGGESAITDHIDHRFTVTRHPSAILIQAGHLPDIGDVNRGLVPEAYQHLARLLRPIRAEFEHSFMKGLTDEQSASWLARFD